MEDFELLEISASDHSLIEKIGRLRVRAWAAQIPEAASMGSWLDHFDKIGRHWVIFSKGEPVASARMTIHQSIEDVPEPEVYAELNPEIIIPPVASFNRLVVDPESRGNGLSKQLDSCRLEAAIAAKCRCIVVETPSGIHRVKQLESFGFVNLGTGAPYDGELFYVNHSAVVLMYDISNTNGLNPPLSNNVELSES